MPPERGASAIVVVVPDAEPLVGHWRARFDSSAADGMPAHVTVLYPFLGESRVDEAVAEQLARLCAAVPAHDVVFRRVRRFPAVLWLDPEPADPLRGLTEAIAARWPQAPPYGGIHDEVIPHLTVASGAPAETSAAIEAELTPQLPLRTRFEAAWLFVFDGRWQQRLRLPFVD